jgi:hypothetical protein
MSRRPAPRPLCSTSREDPYDDAAARDGCCCCGGGVSQDLYRDEADEAEAAEAVLRSQDGRSSMERARETWYSVMMRELCRGQPKR